MKSLLLLSVLILSGCAGWKPSAEIGVGQYIKKADYFDAFYSNCQWPAVLALNLEHDSGVLVKYIHQSHIDCSEGKLKEKETLHYEEPFNDTVYIGWKFAG